jgi:hypothetical protein
LKMRQRRCESAANDSNSPKVNCREGYLATAQIKPVIFSLLPCGCVGNGLGATIKCLGRKTSGAPCNGLGITIKYLRLLTSGAAGTGMGATTKTCDAQRAAPRAMVWAPRLSTCAAPRATAYAPRSSICAAPRDSAWTPRSITCDAQRGNGQGTKIQSLRCKTGGA